MFGRVGAAAAGLALALGVGAASGGAAWAASGAVTAKAEPEGYVRLVFSFDRLPRTQTRLANGILVLSFSEAVDIDLRALKRGPSGVLGAARRDPDGSSVRISLERPARLNVTEAGESLFVDLLPQGWVGLPPGIPKEVLAELGKAAREARAALLEDAQLRAQNAHPLTLDGATHPTFRRLVFGVEPGVPVEMKRLGDKVALTFGASLRFDLPAAKARLPLEFAGLDIRRTADTLTVIAPAPAAVDARGFREDGAYILDIDRADLAPGAGSDVAARDSHPPAPRPAAARDPHAHPEPVAAAPVSADIPTAGFAAAPTRKPSAPKPGKPAPPPPHMAASEAAHPAGPEAGPAEHGHDAPSVTPTAPMSAPQAAPAAESKPADPKPAASAAAKATAPAPGRPELRKVGETLRLVFPFAKPTPAAIFLRGRTLWLVFDDPAAMPIEDLVALSGGAIVSAEQVPLPRGRAFRLKLAEPRLLTAAADGAAWIVSLGDDILPRGGEVTLTPAFSADGRGTMILRLDGLGAVQRLDDPEIGDRLAVTTLSAPIRGLSAPRAFVEFGALASAHGVALTAAADDLTVRAGVEGLSVERDGGLTLSSDRSGQPTHPATLAAIAVLDQAAWTEARSEPFAQRERALSKAAAFAAPENRTEARIALARFYALQRMSAESKAVLDTILAEDISADRDPRVPLMRGAASVELRRPKAALTILNSPHLVGSPEASLWRAVAEAESGRPGAAREAFAKGEPALAALPPDFQARFGEVAVGLALDVRDFAGAVAQFERLEKLPAVNGKGARAVLKARVLEGVGQSDAALAAYKAVADGTEPAAAAEARLRGVELALAKSKISIPDAIVALERLVAGWRGDWIEAEGLARLVGLYADAERWRDAFALLRTSVEAFPQADGTRALQDRMQSRFADLFLSGAVDRMPKLEALALFYDFQELSPSGRRGDELVRSLADKLVEVDLLDQASELLDYQIDNRLQGAARAQVAARAAIVSLMNNKPANAVRVLQKTRQADLPVTLVRTRLLLEARALAQTGRTDVALEMAEGQTGVEAQRLTADILWTARRWGEAGEALEVLLGSAWRSDRPLETAERNDVMRAAIALSLGGDALGVDRLRQKFAAKMADSADAQAFDVVTAPIEARGEAFREVARSIAATATLQGFLEAYRRRAAEEQADPLADRSKADRVEAGAAAPARG